MAEQLVSLIVGGSSGLGLAVAEALAARGERAVLTSRDQARAEAAAKLVGRGARGIALDIADPPAIAGRLAGLGAVRHLVLAALERDQNSVKAYDIPRAVRLVTLKLVGYTAVVHAVSAGLGPDSSIVLFGGQGRERPFPGSTTITSINGGVSSLIRTLAAELAPVRVNAIHPGIVGDSPAWSNRKEATDRARARTPTGRLATTVDIAAAVLFLLDNGSVNGVNLPVDGGSMLL